MTELAGGTINVKSKLGAGSTFTVTCKLAPAFVLDRTQCWMVFAVPMECAPSDSTCASFPRYQPRRSRVAASPVSSGHSIVITPTQALTRSFVPHITTASTQTDFKAQLLPPAPQRPPPTAPHGPAPNIPMRSVPAPSPAPPSGLPRPHILFADDAEVNQKMLCRMLQSMCTVTVARNGLEAVELANSQRFDLVLLDINMYVPRAISPRLLMICHSSSVC